MEGRKDKGDLRECKAVPKYYKSENGILLKRDFHVPDRWRIMAPQQLRDEVMKCFHEERGHFGYSKTYTAILESFFWEGMRTDIRNHVRDCVQCMRHKTDSHLPYKILETIKTKEARDIISVDNVGRLHSTNERYAYVFTCLVVHTRYVTGYSMRKVTTASAIRYMETHFAHLGIPRMIFFDNGSCFVSKKFHAALLSRGVQVCHSTPHHTQSNPVERIHKEMNRLWRLCCVQEHKQWYRHLLNITLLSNYTITENLTLAAVQMHLNIGSLAPIWKQLGFTSVALEGTPW